MPYQIPNQLKNKEFKQPKDFILAYLEIEQGKKIRFGQYKNEKSKNFAFIIPGLFETIEKYFELIHILIERGFDIGVIDLPEQGKSYRSGINPKCRSSRGFNREVDAISAIITHILPQDNKYMKRILIGHSLGGHLSLRYLSSMGNSSPFTGALLSAPMIGMKTDPFPKPVANILAYIIASIGFKDHYVFGEKDWSEENPFNGKKITTHDPIKAHLHDYTFICDPELISSGPSFGWVKEAFKSLKELHNPNALQQITTPIHLYTAEQDEFVDNSGLDNLKNHIAALKHTFVSDAAHELFIETDALRNQIMSDPFIQA